MTAMGANQRGMCRGFAGSARGRASDVGTGSDGSRERMVVALAHGRRTQAAWQRTPDAITAGRDHIAYHIDRV